MNVTEVKNCFGPDANSYNIFMFAGKKEELQTIVGTTYTTLILDGQLFFCVNNPDYIPTDSRMVKI